MSRLIRGFFLIIFCLAVFLAPAALRGADASSPISVTVNGVPAVWEDAAPYMRLGRLMIPFGSFGNTLGAEVKWDADKQEAFIFYRSRYCWVQASNLTMYYGTYTTDSYGRNLLTDVDALELPVRPELNNNRLMAPLTTVAHAIGGFLEWNPVTQAASVIIQPESPDMALTEPAAQPPLTQAQGYFQLLTVDEVLTRYNNDDPFVLVQFNNNLPSAAMYDMLKAAADMKVKVYGLDIDGEDAALYLPFALTGGYEVYVHLINGYERVQTMGDPSYAESAQALSNYLVTE